MYRYLFSLCGEADLAEELTQETFCQALRGLNSFRDDCTPQVWLCAIAKRLWFAECRWRERVAPLEEEDLNRLTAPDNPAAEPETAEQARSHLAGCAACREVEAYMRAGVPLQSALRRAPRFLRRVKRTRLLATLLAILVVLWCMWWLYDREFHYPSTEVSRLAAVEDYIPSPEGSTTSHRIKAGTPLRVIAAEERNGSLYVAYAAGNADRVHGVIRLDRGWNGKYRLISATEAPFPYTAGVLGMEMTSGDGSEFNALIGDSCREIYGVRVTYSMALDDTPDLRSYEKSYAVKESDFLWILEEAVLKEELGIPAETPARVVSIQVEFLDREGRDVTDPYRDEAVEDNWGGGKGTAELFLVYVYMGIVAFLGVVFVRYFLHRD